MSDTSIIETDPVSEARKAWESAQVASDAAHDRARRAAIRMSQAITMAQPERIDALAAEAKTVSSAWGEANAAEDAAYRAYAAAKAGA